MGKALLARHEKQTSSQRKYREHLSNLPSHHDNVTHQGISISQPCYEEKRMECGSCFAQYSKFFPCLVHGVIQDMGVGIPMGMYQ